MKKKVGITLCLIAYAIGFYTAGYLARTMQEALERRREQVEALVQSTEQLERSVGRLKYSAERLKKTLNAIETLKAIEKEETE